MIRGIYVTNEYDESIMLELDNPWDTGLCITGISGLGPLKANVNTTELATMDGAILNSTRIPARNIVFSFKLLEDKYTNMVETTRLRTYQYFPLKKMVTMIFVTDNRQATITGVVESNEPDIFQKEETAQISIICPDPYFRASDRDINLNGVEGYFEFPFSNESLTEPLIELSGYTKSVGTEYVYDGDADAGIVAIFHAYGPCQNITLYNATTQEAITMDTSKIKLVTEDGNDDIIDGDDIELSTMDGEKHIYLHRGGVEYNILPVLPKIPQWITVQKGRNVFGYRATSGESNVSVTIKTVILYEGV